MSMMASQITSLTSVYSTVSSGADKRKHQSSASLAFVWGIHQWLVNSPHKWPVTRKMVSIWWRHHDLCILHQWITCSIIASLPLPPLICTTPQTWHPPSVVCWLITGTAKCNYLTIHWLPWNNNDANRIMSAEQELMKHWRWETGYFLITIWISHMKGQRCYFSWRMVIQMHFSQAKSFISQF